MTPESTQPADMSKKLEKIDMSTEDTAYEKFKKKHKHCLTVVQSIIRDYEANRIHIPLEMGLFERWLSTTLDKLQERERIKCGNR